MKSDQNIVVGDMVGFNQRADPLVQRMIGTVIYIGPPRVPHCAYTDGGQGPPPMEATHEIQVSPSKIGEFTIDCILSFRNHLYKIAGPSIDVTETTSCETLIGRQFKVTKECLTTKQA